MYMYVLRERMQKVYCIYKREREVQERERESERERERVQRVTHSQVLEAEVCQCVPSKNVLRINNSDEFKGLSASQSHRLQYSVPQTSNYS